MQEISETVSRPLHLGACGFPRLLTLAHCTSPVKKNVHDRPWTDVTVLDSQKWPSPTFWEKTTKASDRKLPDGRELL